MSGYLSPDNVMEDSGIVIEGENDNLKKNEDAWSSATLNPSFEMQQVKRFNDLQIVLTRTFPALQATVFAALTEPNWLREWLGSTGFTFVTCEVDLRVGGRFRYVFARGSGRRIEVLGEFITVDPPHGFRYVESYDFSPLVVEVHTRFTARGVATELHQELTYRTEAERDSDFVGVANSSSEAFARLHELLRRQAN